MYCIFNSRVDAGHAGLTPVKRDEIASSNINNFAQSFSFGKVSPRNVKNFIKNLVHDLPPPPDIGKSEDPGESLKNLL